MRAFPQPSRLSKQLREVSWRGSLSERFLRHDAWLVQRERRMLEPVLTWMSVRFSSCEQQSASLNRAGAGFERRKPTGNFIGVEEAKTLHFLGKKLLRKGGLARTVAAGDDVDGGRPGWHGYATNSGVNRPRQPKRLLRVWLTTSSFWRASVFIQASRKD
jgi:hypothetical protein